MIESWQDGVMSGFLSMYRSADADTQAEIRRMVLPVLRVEDTPSDLVPISGSFHDAPIGAPAPPIDMTDRVSHVTRNYTRPTPPEPNRPPWERKDSDTAAMKRTRKLPMGRPLEP